MRKLNKFGSVLGLDSIKNLLEKVGNPERKLKAIHVAGTNGKGSTSSFIQNILIKAGYKVGVFSSPAVFDEREIIRINHCYISEEAMAEKVNLLKDKCEDLVTEGKAHPTIFEVETAMALLYFMEQQCDVVIVECGMGGLTDATNVFESVLCSVITTISLDHTQFLGDSIEKIAEIKSGIIKKKCPVVASCQTKEAMDVIRNKAFECDSDVVFTGHVKEIHVTEEVLKNQKLESKCFDDRDINEKCTCKKIIETKFTYRASNDDVFHITLSALGTYQIINSVTAIETALVLEKQGFNVKKHIIEGLKNTFWQGRLEAISDNPLVVIDGGHNPDAIKKLRDSIDLYFTNKKITFIMGVLSDKDFDKEAQIIADRAEKIITVTPDNPRALDAESLAQTVSKYNENTVFSNTMDEAIDMALNTIKSGESDMILAFGSLSYLKQLRNGLKI